jgi:hypothetical protein
MSPAGKSRPGKVVSVICGVVVFLASFAVLAFWVVPSRNAVRFDGRTGDAVTGRFPVLAVAPETAGAVSPKFILANWSALDDATIKTRGFSFLLPAGNSEVVDQDGDPASFSAEELSPGRQRIRLTAQVGDYTFKTEYEAEAKKTVPLRVSHMGPQDMVFPLLASVLLGYVGFFVAGRVRRTSIS